MMDKTVHGPLGEQAIDSYREKGYLIYRDHLFDDDGLDSLNTIFEEHRAADPDRIADEFDTPHFDDSRLFDFLLAPAVLDVVEGIIGPNIILWSSHFICKDARVGRATPWHSDSAYWNGRLDVYDRLVTVWLALDEVDRGNGCMRVIPGSHLTSAGFSSYRAVDGAKNTFKLELSEVDPTKSSALELRRGDCSLHDGRIVHGADANTSDRRRLGYTMRYLAAETRVVPERNVGHRLWLARGHAVVPNHYENV